MISKVCADLKVQGKKKETAEFRTEKLSVVKVAFILSLLIFLILCKALMYFTIITLRGDHNEAE